MVRVKVWPYITKHGWHQEFPDREVMSRMRGVELEYPLKYQIFKNDLYILIYCIVFVAKQQLAFNDKPQLHFFNFL